MLIKRHITLDGHGGGHSAVQTPYCLNYTPYVGDKEENSDLLCWLLLSPQLEDESSSTLPHGSALCCSSLVKAWLVFAASPGRAESAFCLGGSALGLSALGVSRNWSKPWGRTPFRPTPVKKLHGELVPPWWPYKDSFLNITSDLLLEDWSKSRCIISSVE